MNALERRSTFALASIFALRMLGLFMIIPVFAIAGQQYYQYATPALIGFAIGVYGLSQAIFQIPFSLWADKYNRKRLIIIGLVLFILGGAIAGWSENIYGVIVGRAIAGAGAISAVVMALLSDVTREEQRSKAMAMIGMSIGLSFIIAFSISPWITHQIGMNGLFWLTSIMGLIAIGILSLVPNIQRFHSPVQQSYTQQLKQVLSMADLNKLHISIFILHLLLAAMFVYVPSQLVHYADIPLKEHGITYLPLLIVGLLCAFPCIILAEKYKKMREILLATIVLVIISFAVLSVGVQITSLLFIALGLFFIAFNIMEAILPSWLSKIAPLQSKATAMGINSSCQFLGAFCGGILGGQLLLLNQHMLGWVILAVISIIWLILAFQLNQPRYLSTIMLRLKQKAEQPEHLMQQLLNIHGVHEVILMPDNEALHLKVERHKLTDEHKQQLEQLLQQEVNFSLR